MSFRGQGGSAKPNKIPPLRGARLLHQPVMKQLKGWRIVLSAGNDSCEQPTAWPVMLSALCFLKGKYSEAGTWWKEAFSRYFALAFEIEGHWYRSVTDEGVGLLQGCWQSWSVVSQSQQKQIYNIMQVADGNGAAVPQATFTPSPSHFAQILSPGNWLVNIQLIGWSLNFSPCEQ